MIIGYVTDHKTGKTLAELREAVRSTGTLWEKPGLEEGRLGFVWK